MISAACWIRKGAARSTPISFVLDEEAYEKIAQKIPSLKDLKIDEDDGDFERDLSEASQSDASDDAADMSDEAADLEKKPSSPPAKAGTDSDGEDDGMAKYNLQDYDNESSEVSTKSMFANIADLAYFKSNDEDPYLAKGDAAAKGNGEDDAEEYEEDKEALTIRPTDNLIVAARTEDNLNFLDVYVYEEDADNLYVHHDIMIPSFPLCTEWISAASAASNTGNFVAVGTFEPEIEIWNMDVLDAVYPEAVLGQRPVADVQATLKSAKSKKKTPAASKQLLPDRHTDAVMTLSWNRLHPNMLLSGSADTSIKLWDLNAGSVLRSFDDVHRDKVQSVAWNPSHASVVASGSFDRTAALFDVRSPADAKRFSLAADVECLRWNPHAEHCFAVSDEAGYVHYFDNRTSSPIFTLQCHESATTAIDFNHLVPNMLVTGSSDKTVKLWSLENGGQTPTCIASKHFGVGKIFTAAFCFDTPYLLTMAGSTGELVVWNVNENDVFRKSFEEIVQSASR